MTLQTTRTETPRTSRLYAGAAHHIQMRIVTLRPAHTTEQVAATVALTGNPSGA